MMFRYCAGLVLAVATILPAMAQQQQQQQPQQQRPATPQPAAAPAPAPKPAAPITGAVLQGLDKLVARVQEIEAPLNKETKFGTLSIMVRQCTVSPPEAPPEASAFLEISEQRPGEEAKKVFSGWMFASSPALSAMEHPIYDVWVVGCKTSDSAEPVKSR
ncbi:MAG: hypothetical protein K0S54_2958 [Alphaproteobacteria bacterium]|nr:hypothetical protein [Alphaproteobacteria bacterium]